MESGMSDAFATGDIVKLKKETQDGSVEPMNGAPEMTVTEASDVACTCVWTENGQDRRAGLLPEALILVRKAPAD